MMSAKHAFIVPLIGGQALGQMQTFESDPEYVLSYRPFESNDSHYINHLRERGWSGEYVFLDEKSYNAPYVDVVGTTCPCAGLSSLSPSANQNAGANDWMRTTTEYVLGTIRPRVLFGENAPGFSSSIGDVVRNDLREIGRKHGYTMSVYRTATILHGGPQVRERSFYFFWKDTRTPLLPWFHRKYTTIEETLDSVTSNFMHEPINTKTPSSDDPYYRYVLEEIMGGVSHQQFLESVDPARVLNKDVLAYIEEEGHDYLRVGEWMRCNGLDKEADRCVYRHEKIASGKNIMRRQTLFSKDRLGAFVGHTPFMLSHHREDRYITYREAMTIMGLPSDFELLKPRANVNHMCQNVPVKTAKDMSDSIRMYLNGELEMVDTDYVLQKNRQMESVYDRESMTLEAFMA